MSLNLWSGRWRGMTPEGDVHRRARNVISPSGGIVRGKFPSRKNGRMVHHEGLLELEAIYLFETSPRIVRYREQPITIHYPDGAKLRRYTPDFELELITGKIVYIEVKPMSSLQHEKVRHKLDCITEYMHRSETAFVILTDQIIRQEPRLANLRWIYHRSSRVPPTPDAISVAINTYRDSFPLSITAASTLLNVGGVDLYSLLMSGQLCCSLQQTISQETLIELNVEVDNGWFCIAQEQGF